MRDEDNGILRSLTVSFPVITGASALTMVVRDLLDNNNLFIKILQEAKTRFFILISHSTNSSCYRFQHWSVFLIAVQTSYSISIASFPAFQDDFTMCG